MEEEVSEITDMIRSGIVTETRQEFEARHEEVRAKYQALRPHEVSSLEIAEIPRGEGFLRRVVDKYKDLFGEYRNADKNMSGIRFDSGSVKGVVKHAIADGKIALLRVAPDLIKDGVYLETTRRNEDGLLSHIFAAKATVDGEKRIAGVVVREDANGRRYYDHRSLTQMALDNPKGGERTPNPVAQAKPDGYEPIHKILQKYFKVNSKNNFSEK